MKFRRRRAGVQYFKGPKPDLNPTQSLMRSVVNISNAVVIETVTGLVIDRKGLIKACTGLVIERVELRPLQGE